MSGESQRRYQNSEKGLIVKRRYDATEKGLARKRRYNNRKYREYREQGLCLHCGQPAAPGLAKCEKHAARDREYSWLY